MPIEIAEWGLIKDRPLVGRLGRLADRIHTEVGPLEVTIRTSREPVAFADRLRLRERPIRAGGFWGRAFTCAWFHISGTAPAGHQHLALLLDTDGEALVRDASGRVVGQVTSRVTFIEELGAHRGKTRIDITEQTAPGGVIDLWLDAGFNGKLMQPYGFAQVKHLALVAVDDGLEALYYDLLAVEAAARSAPDGLRQRYADAAAAAWGCLSDHSPVEVAAARAVLAPLLDGQPDDDFTLTAIGHGHLDLAWLWPIRETRRKSERTLVGQLDALARYPEAHYGVSQPQQLAWLAEQHPELHEAVRQAMLDGRIEAQGGLWVEPDTNLPGGESLVRQMLYGQRYWEQLIGRRVDFCWLPDTFGYSGNLPQLLRGAGMDSFMTIKLSWNEVTEFPYRSFRWRGIDGSEVLVHMPPEGTYNSSATPQALRLARQHATELPVADRAMLVYGSGDGGGGPGPAHYELLRRIGSLTGFPKVEHGLGGDVLAALGRVREQLPAWDGELYLQKHQGTYTTQGAVKRGNRRLEHALHDAEYLAAAAWLRGAEYPHGTLDQIWREVLLHQFHDMLPGSSINRVHKESRAVYARLEPKLIGSQRDAITAVAGDIPEQWPAQQPPFVVNTLSTPRQGHSQVEGRWYSYEVGPHESAQLRPAAPATGQVDETTMTTDELSVRWRADGSAIESLTHGGVEFSGGHLNKLWLHHDPYSYFDAWDIRQIAFSLPRRLLRPDDVETFTDGPRLVRRSHYRHGRTRITQDAIAQAGVPYLLFDTTVEWRESWRMLRSESRPAHWADQINCEIQFGHLARSTRNQTPEERAQLEVCAHQWVDISTAEAGLALLNDSKYGHRAKDGRLSLDLLRSPVYPDPFADRGWHRFSYALYPHLGGLAGSRTIEWARDLNAPLVLSPAPITAPVRLVGEPGQVAIVAVKKAEDAAALIVRAHDLTGRGAEVGIEAGFEVAEVCETNLLEDPLPGEVDLARLRFGPFQVRTFRLTPAH